MNTFLAYLNFFFGLVLLGAVLVFYFNEGFGYRNVVWTAPVFIFCGLTVLAGARVLQYRKPGWGLAGIGVFVIGFSYYLLAVTAAPLESHF